MLVVFGSITVLAFDLTVGGLAVAELGGDCLLVGRAAATSGMGPYQEGISSYAWRLPAGMPAV